MDILEAVGWTQTATPLHIIIFRLVLAAGLGAIIGLEREAHHNTAGLRTHILIATAAALFALISFEMHYLLTAGSDSVKTDPLRTVEAVTAGVAFLGAGTIFRSDGSVHGLTTGAGMWLAGAIGFACAMGFYALAILATILGLISLFALYRVSENVGR